MVKYEYNFVKKFEKIEDNLYKVTETNTYYYHPTQLEFQKESMDEIFLKNVDFVTNEDKQKEQIETTITEFKQNVLNTTTKQYKANMKNYRNYLKTSEEKITYEQFVDKMIIEFRKQQVEYLKQAILNANNQNIKLGIELELITKALKGEEAIYTKKLADFDTAAFEGKTQEELLQDKIAAKDKFRKLFEM